MKRLFLIGVVFLTTISIYADSSQAIVKIHPGFSKTLQQQAQNAKVCSDRDTKINNNGISEYDQCMKIYLFKSAVENYYKKNIEKLKNDSEKIKMETPKTTSWKADYMLFCNLYIIVDELKSEGGWYKGVDQSWWESQYQKAMANGIYYMQMNCELINIKTNEIITVTETKRKYQSKNGLMTTKRLIKEGEDVIKDGFPKAKELENAIENNIRFKNADFKYIFDDENKKYANAKETGKLEITELVPGYISNHHPLTEFTLRAKQGKFIKSNSKEIKFTDYEYLKKNKKISFPYQTYDCQDKEIEDKKFETFTLTITEQLNKEKSILVKEFKVSFECPKPYYTATYTEKTEKKVKVLKKYRGMGKDLKSTDEDHLEFYIFIDVAHDQVVQYFREERSYRKFHHESYKLDMKSCQYKIDVKEKKIEKKGARPLIFSDDMGWGIEDSTKFYVKLPFSDKRVSFTWKKLKENRGIYAKKTYMHDPFGLTRKLGNKYGLKKIAKESKKEMQKMAQNSADYISKAEHDEGLKKFQKLVTIPGTPHDVQCGMDVSMESLMMQPIDGTLPEKISVKLNIRQSTKSEIAEMKASMKK